MLWNNNSNVRATISSTSSLIYVKSNYFHDNSAKQIYQYYSCIVGKAGLKCQVITLESKLIPQSPGNLSSKYILLPTW